MPEEAPRWKQRFADNKEARDWNLASLLLSLPLLLVGSYYYGANALRNAVVAALAAALCELVAARLILRKRTVDDWNAVVTGVWIACMLPADLLVKSTFPAPVYAAVGAVFAVLVVKIPFGGTMHAPFTPAAAGMAFLTVCFPKTVFNYLPSAAAPPPHNQSLASMLQYGRSVFDGKQLSGILLGQTTGPMGAGCILLIGTALLAALLLKKRRTAALASLGFIATVAAMSFLFPRVTGGVRLASVGMELCSGSLLFAAVYLLPDPAIMPQRWFTRLGFGALAGLLCVLLRQMSSFEESVCFAVLLADAFMPLLYRLQAELRHQKEFRERVEAMTAEERLEKEVRGNA
ncbi:MAG: RnfABCDGE type electron transport complex subunit D [Oscillospiraceae bacterium]|jgi:Na+-translocating ferredoxin:NAD+ oxidoreductase RnfD subunit|nr:RnfABCDGE type electron transport complex subunit D [Oscillospiraceae bacterium]